jgi:PAS domain S-box-containing protein
LEKGNRALRLVVLSENRVDTRDLHLPSTLPDWEITCLALAEADPAELQCELLLLFLPPDHQGLRLLLARFRIFNPDCQVLLAEYKQDSSWYRHAIGLGVDDLLPFPMDRQQWGDFLSETAEAMSTGLEQSRFLGRLERSTHHLEESRRNLADMLLSSYDNLGRMHRQLENRLGQLSTLYQFGRDLSQDSNWDHALEQFLRTCVHALGFSGVALLLWSFEGQRLGVRSRQELGDKLLDLTVSKLLEIGMEECSRQEMMALRQGSVELGERVLSRIDQEDLIILPLMHGGESQGFLVFQKEFEGSEEIKSDFQFLRTVQTIMGEEIANAKNLHRLKKLEEYNRTVLESVHAAVLTVDGYGKVSYRNPRAAELFGERLAPGQMFRFDERFHLIDGDESGLTTEDWIQRECLLHVTDRQDDQGGERHLLLSSTRLPLRHESDISFVLVCEDLTEYKHLESELRRAERLSSLGQLSAGMAHEIRNPLAGIAMTAQVLQSRLGDQPDIIPFLERIQEETGRLERIIRSLLDFSRPAKPRLRATDLDQISKRVLRDVAGQAEAVGVNLVIPPEMAEWNAWGDTDQIQQVLLNLLLNAIQACGEGDEVGIRLERVAVVGAGEGRIRVTVFDSGCGVPAELRSKLFDPFYTTKAEGTGLGLSVCQKIMEEHGGQIRYQPRVGGGSEFRLELAPATAGADFPTVSEPSRGDTP